MSTHALTGRARVRVLAAAAALAVLFGQALVTAPDAAALPAPPKGAYWYTLLDLQKAWRTSEGAGVTVAVIDGGVQANLGDLKGKVRPGLDLIGTHPQALSESPKPGTPDFGHGTDMAALIAGTGNGGGMIGVAPKATILPVNVTDPAGDIDSGTAARGIRWAVEHGANIINLSFGVAGACDPAEGASVKYAYQHDVIVVASAGDSPGPVSSPADCPGALAIGGVDAAVAPWVNSPSGPEIDFVAPAYNLVNEELSGVLHGPYPGNAGTSQAAALVSGTFALLRSRFPNENARQIVTRALYDVHNGLGAGRQGYRAGDQLGYGMILPRYAVTTPPPAGAKNPIYTRFASELGTSSSSSAPSAPATPVSSSAGSSPASLPAGQPSSSAATASGGGSSPPGLIFIVVAILAIFAVLALTIVAVIQRRGRQQPRY